MSWSLFCSLLLFYFSFGVLPLAGEAAKMRSRLRCWWWLMRLWMQFYVTAEGVVLPYALEGRLNLVSGTKCIQTRNQRGCKGYTLLELYKSHARVVSGEWTILAKQMTAGL
ncbi:hypothetical protein J3E69DRAFT_334744 [Trichoderma sp. SZMC 28015]